ncbi:MAG: hypothetical protein HC836_41010 [Richelia sp. RM2_1_2]|nr:hypothetical protein [Richelia sp. RM2_1_2]
MKLLAYILSGQTLGVDIEIWDNINLLGNPPFIIGEDEDMTPSGYTDISTILGWGNLGGNVLNYNNVRIQIKYLLPDSLSGLTESELEVVHNYSLDNYCLIYDYIDYSNYANDINAKKPPINLDYDIIGLHKKRYLVKGELVKVEYYGEYNPVNKQYSKLVVSEDRIYYRENQMAHKREMTIKWYLNDGSVGFSKDTLKYYSTTEAMSELDTRRSNIISELKINTVGLIMMCSGVTSIQAQVIGKPLLSSYSTQISKYVQGYEQELRDSIANDNIYQYLNCVIPNTGGITIRQYLISGLTIDYSINNINT